MPVIHHPDRRKLPILFANHAVACSIPGHERLYVLPFGSNTSNTSSSSSSSSRITKIDVTDGKTQQTRRPASCENLQTAVEVRLPNEAITRTLAGIASNPSVTWQRNDVTSRPGLWPARGARPPACLPAAVPVSPRQASGNLLHSAGKTAVHRGCGRLQGPGKWFGVSGTGHLGHERHPKNPRNHTPRIGDSHGSYPYRHLNHAQ